MEIWINIGLREGLVPEDNKPLQEPKLIQDYWHLSQCNFTKNVYAMVANILIKI